MFKDNLFRKKCKVSDFKFNKKVADVFDEMLERSVPFYSEIQRMVGELAEDFAMPGSPIYDLGCSTGITMAYLAKKLKKKNIKLIGIDNSGPMLKHAKERLRALKLLSSCSLIKADIEEGIALKAPSLVIMVLTLQFIRPANRETLISNIYESLRKGGALIVVEKIVPSDPITNRIYLKHYHQFKKRNGYSSLEISRKREALEKVLVPYTIDENKDLLRRCGFEAIDTFLNWYNFAGFLAVKE